MAERFSNEYQTTLNGAIDDNDTSLVVDSATGAPAANFRIRIDDELMLVTNVSSLTFTVTRGIEGTTAAAHDDEAVVTHVLTADSLATAFTGPDRFLARTWFFDDCYWKGSGNPYYEGGITLVSTNGGSLAGSSEGFLNHPGHFQVHTGTNSAGEAMLAQYDGTLTRYQIRPEGTRLRAGAIIRGSTLSNGTNRYAVRMTGLVNDVVATPSSGLFFRYTDDVNSGKIQAVSRASGTETATDTGVAYASLTFFKLEIDFASDQSEALYYVNGTLVATHTTNLPAASALLGFHPVVITKSIGTSDRALYLEAYWLIQDFDTQR